MSEDEKNSLVDWFGKQPVKWVQSTIDTYNREFNKNVTLSQARHIYYRTINNKKNEQSKVEEIHQQTNKDGSIVSNVLLKGVGKRNMKPNDLMVVHGFDPKCWTLKRVISSVWTVNTQEKEKYNFQSKIAVAPIVKEFDIEKAIDKQVKRVEPFKPTPGAKKQSTDKNASEKVIAINISDTHFNGDGMTYDNNLDRLSSKLMDEGVQDGGSDIAIVLNLLGDIVNIDTIKGQTTKGTQLETFDIEGQLDDALKFMERVFTQCIHYATSIHVQGVYGNHDNTLSYYIYRMLEQRYSKHDFINFDISRKDSTGGMFKAVGVNGIMIGITHGDKNGSQVPMLMATQFPNEWAGSTTRELFQGHIHHERTKQYETSVDNSGLVIRTVPTAKPVDTYEQSRGFVTSQKRFMGAVYEDGYTEEIFYF